MQPKESLDLMNVGYEDVLHLYRGWRKTEAALKDKDKELSSLKDRTKQLQDSHVKFRGQIEALESVKEVNLALQAQLAQLQQENRHLLAENQELANLNIRAEEILRQKEGDVVDQARALKDVQLDFATLRGRYEESMKMHKDLERLAADEQAARMSMESRLTSADQTMDEVREENRMLRQRLESAHIKLAQCDQELLHASEQLASISREVVNITTTKDALSFAESEVGVLKGDMARLMRLLEQSPGTRDFVAHWQDSGGMHFVGIDRDPSGSSLKHSHGHSHSHGFEGLTRSALSMSGENHAQLDDALRQFDLTPIEFNHLKELHGTDPYPMTSTLGEETEYWVPADAARLGVQFMASRFPNASPKVILDFLRNMNKIWLRRERRKIKRVKEVLGGNIEDLKRKLQAAKPYKGVIAERQIRRLQSQVKAGLSKTLNGRARGKLEGLNRDDSRFEEVDLDADAGYQPPHERRLCRLQERAKSYGDGDVTRVAEEKLLEASLVSLDNVSRRLNVSRGAAESLRAEESAAATAAGGGAYPSDSYLRGALWLGRNLSLLSEELVEHLETYRARYLQELSEISKDAEKDARRACHRLVLLGGSGIQQASAFATESRDRVREILQGTAALEPGNALQFQRFLGTLPIESTLGINSSSTPGRRLSGGGGGADRSRSPLSTARRSSDAAPATPASRFISVLDSSLHTADLSMRSHTR